MKSFIALILAVTMAGCATRPLSELEVRNLEEKVFEGTYENAYKATLQVLQDKGFVLEHTDFAAGTMKGSTEKPVRVMLGGLSFRHVISVTVEQFGKNTVKERISLFLEAAQNSRFLTAERERDPKYVQDLYAAIQKEIFVRENLNR